jgi:hypothetical protein
MGFLDKLLGRKKADQPQSAPEPPAMPPADTGTAEHTQDEGEHDHSHEGEHGHEH